MARLTRAGVFRRKNALRLSKYETSLEHAFKELDVETTSTTTGTITLTRIPDVVIIPNTLTGNLVIDFVVPAADPQAYNRIVKMVLQDDLVGGETVTVKVNNTGSATLTASKTQDFYIADASAATAPVALTQV